MWQSEQGKSGIVRHHIGDVVYHTIFHGDGYYCRAAIIDGKDAGFESETVSVYRVCLETPPIGTCP